MAAVRKSHGLLNATPLSQLQSRLKTADSKPSRLSRRLRARLPVISRKSGPITTPRLSPFDGGLVIVALNQLPAISVSSRQRIGVNPTCSSVTRVSGSLSKKLVEASRAQGTGYTT